MKIILIIVAIYLIYRFFKRKPSKTHEDQQEEIILQSIQNDTPAIIKKVPSDVLDILRVVAKEAHQTGSSISNLIPNNIVTGINLNSEAVCRMLIFNAYFKRDIAEYKSNGITHVYIDSVNDDRTCEICKKADGKKYSLKKLPEIPHARCKCETGCRCGIIEAETWEE